MKRGLLVGLVVAIGIVVVGCGESKTEKKKEPVVSKEENVGEKYLTQEEMDEIGKEQDNDLKENIKYRFAKVISVENTEISIEFLELDGDYKYKGFSENLDIDTSKLSGTGEEGKINLIGASTNVSEINELKEGVFLRIGNYEKPKDKETSFKDGMLLSIDMI